jgi:hypothetical protein
MRHKVTSKTASSDGRNAVVVYLGRLLGVIVTTATIAVGLHLDDTSVGWLVSCIVGGLAGLLVYCIVIKVYWRD